MTLFMSPRGLQGTLNCRNQQGQGRLAPTDSHFISLDYPHARDLNQSHQEGHVKAQHLVVAP